MRDIVKITYTSDSGAILPELRWHEEYCIFMDHIEFVRSGFVEETQVNQGTWQVPGDEQSLSELFDLLESIDLKTIKRIEPDESPDGGGSQSYGLFFSDGQSFSLDYTPGTTYENGELIVDAVADFIHTLELPADAEVQYVFSDN